MARYDRGWGRPPAPQYDRGYWRPPYGGYDDPRESFYPEQGYSQRSGYFPQMGWDDAMDLEGVYGPARYGLGPYHERLRQRRRSDDQLREDVEEALFYDTWVDAEAITVKVEDGIVMLSGALPNYEEIRYATDDAWDVEGVLGVRSELTVRDG